jgi:hypothetical protein
VRVGEPQDKENNDFRISRTVLVRLPIYYAICNWILDKQEHDEDVWIGSTREAIHNIVYERNVCIPMIASMT